MGISQLKEDLETPQEVGWAIMQIAKQARNTERRNFQARLSEEVCFCQFGQMEHAIEESSAAVKGDVKA